MSVGLQGVSRSHFRGAMSFSRFPWAFVLSHEIVADKGSNIGFWALDPVDGTNGFLRGEQYAIALGLIVDGKVVVGAVACPNLPIDPAQPQGPKGVLFSAVRNQGTTERPLDPASTSIPREIHTSTISRVVDASFCEGVQEAGHYSHEAQASVARRLKITKPSVRIDSQAKYGCLARGDGDIYLRLSVNPEHKENVWVRTPRFPVMCNNKTVH